MSVKTLDAVSHDGTMLNTTTNGPVDGAWFTVQNPQSGRAAQLVYIASLIAGTCTWVLEGRNNPGDTPIAVDTAAASKSALVPHYRQFRFRLTAAAAATFQGSMNSVMRQ